MPLRRKRRAAKISREDGHVDALRKKKGRTYFTIIERDSLGVPHRLVAPNGQITELMINGENHLTQIRYEDASRYDFSYSEGGLLTEKIDPRGERYTRIHYPDGFSTAWSRA